MSKTGRKNKVYSAEFKIGVIMDMREHRLGYHETVRKYWKTEVRANEYNYINTVKRITNLSDTLLCDVFLVVNATANRITLSKI